MSAASEIVAALQAAGIAVIAGIKSATELQCVCLGPMARSGSYVQVRPFISHFGDRYGVDSTG